MCEQTIRENEKRGRKEEEKADRWVHLRKINLYEKNHLSSSFTPILSRISLQLVRVLVSRHHLGRTLF